MDEKLFNKLYKMGEEIVLKNQDLIIKTGRSIVACCVVGESGNIYTGLNVGWWHSTCAEITALSNAWQGGERQLTYLMAIKLNRLDNKVRIVSPCGICREMYFNLQPEIKIILSGDKTKYRVKTLGELLPDFDYNIVK